jgi:hypothetical protein
LRQRAEVSDHFRREALSFGDALDFDGDRIDGLLDALEALASFRVRPSRRQASPIESSRPRSREREADGDERAHREERDGDDDRSFRDLWLPRETWWELRYHRPAEPASIDLAAGLVDGLTGLLARFAGRFLCLKSSLARLLLGRPRLFLRLLLCEVRLRLSLKLGRARLFDRLPNFGADALWLLSC